MALNYTPPDLGPFNRIAKGFFAYVGMGEVGWLALHANCLEELVGRSPTLSVLARISGKGLDIGASEIVFRNGQVGRDGGGCGNGNESGSGRGSEGRECDGLLIPFRFKREIDGSGKKFRKTLLNVVFFAAELIEGKDDSGDECEENVFVNRGKYRAGSVLQGLNISLVLIGSMKRKKAGCSVGKRQRNVKKNIDADAVDSQDDIKCLDDEVEVIEVQVPLKRRRVSTE